MRFGLILSAHALGAMSLLSVLTAGPRIAADLGLTAVQVGALASFYSAALAAASLPGGLVSDRLGTRRALALAAALVATGLAIAASARGFAPLGGGVALCGLGYGVINPAAGRAVTLWFTPAWRTTLMSLKQTGVPGGAAIGSATAALGAAWGWQAGIWAAALVAACLSALFVAFLPRDRVAPGRGVPFRPVATLRAVLGLPGLGRANLAAGLTNGGQFALWAFLPDLIQRGAAGYALALGLGALHLGTFAGRVFWGVAADRLFGGDARAALRWLLVVAVAGAGTLWGAGALGMPGLVAGAGFLLGFTICAAIGLHVAVTAGIAPADRLGGAIGYTMLVTNLGGVLVPLALGAVLARFGVAGFALGLAAAALLALGLLAGSGRRA
ncbi:MFS transporter [Meridianimarinicoccus sp. RP-17]|uniref:MFS transporter n=1 Tax=Meridianimarinicoccus zhengii TaxID=2056810 RepID=UPI0013A70A75|nr:MFS transporter [Phycocomes zhengii]